MKIKILQAVAVMVLLIPLLMQLEYVYENKEPKEKQPLRVVFIQEHTMVDMAEAEPYVSEKIDTKRELIEEYNKLKEEWKAEAKEQHEAYLTELARQKKAAQVAQTYSEPAPSAPTNTAPSSDGYLGTYRCTGYVATGSACASGVMPESGVTIASNSLPMGTRVYIEGIGERVVQDTGGMDVGTLDIFCNSVDECYAITGNYDVYIIEE
jgi:3D (Asp-Asp-Asp) domain-containing protein